MGIYKNVKLRTPNDLCRYCEHQVYDRDMQGFRCKDNQTPFFSGRDVGCKRFKLAELRFVLLDPSRRRPPQTAEGQEPSQPRQFHRGRDEEDSHRRDRGE